MLGPSYCLVDTTPEQTPTICMQLYDMYLKLLCVTCTGVRYSSRYGAGGNGPVPVHDLLKLCLAQRGP